MKLKIYFHASAEALFDAGARAGMSEAAADYFRHWGEVAIEAEVNLETGAVGEAQLVDHRPAFRGAAPGPQELPEPVIAMTEVSSSNIAVIGYDAPSRTLAVRFKGGIEWRYAAVGASTWEGMRAAQSIGSYFATYIKPHCTARKIS